MIVNKERLKRLIVFATENCLHCPLDRIGLCNANDCVSTLKKWLTEFDIQTALEEGAHIVNDKAIFPLQEVKIEMFEEDEA